MTGDGTNGCGGYRFLWPSGKAGSGVDRQLTCLVCLHFTRTKKKIIRKINYMAVVVFFF